MSAEQPEPKKQKIDLPTRAQRDEIKEEHAKALLEEKAKVYREEREFILDHIRKHMKDAVIDHAKECDCRKNKVVCKASIAANKTYTYPFETTFTDEMRTEIIKMIDEMLPEGYSVYTFHLSQTGFYCEIRID
jgi:hypothetical protein